MAEICSIHDFSSTIQDMLEEYAADDVTDALEQAITETADYAKKAVKKSGDFNGKTYRSGWTSQIEKKGYATSAVVYNSKRAGLAHLLEFGHIMANGKRSKSFEHIAPVNDEVEKVLIEKLEAKL